MRISFCLPEALWALDCCVERCVRLWALYLEKSEARGAWERRDGW